MYGHINFNSNFNTGGKYNYSKSFLISILSILSKQCIHPIFESNDQITLLGFFIFIRLCIAVDSEVTELGVGKVVYDAFNRGSGVHSALPCLIEGVAHTSGIRIIAVFDSTK